MIRIDKFSNRRPDFSRSKNNCKPFFAPQFPKLKKLLPADVVKKIKGYFLDTRNAMAGIKTADGKVWKA